jgi:hypothetical protein
MSSFAEIASMPDIREYKTIEEAAGDARVPYTAYWIRRLCQQGKIDAEKFGAGRKSVWLVHIPSLLAYVAEMERLGTQKHATGG